MIGVQISGFWAYTPKFEALLEFPLGRRGREEIHAEQFLSQLKIDYICGRVCGQQSFIYSVHRIMIRLELVIYE